MHEKIENWAQAMLKCVRCAKCNSICPTLEERGWEVIGPRGRIRMALGMLQGKISPNELMTQGEYTCLICNHCVDICPSGVECTEIILHAREEMFNRGCAPESSMMLVEALEESHNIFDMEQDDRTIWSMMDADAEEVVEDRTNTDAKIGYFVGCLGSFMGRLSQIPLSLVKTMDHLGLDFTLLGEDEWCCGSPYYLAGGREMIKELAEHHISAFNNLGVEKVIATCAGCYRVFKHLYEDVGGIKPPFEVVHANEFLADLLDRGKLQLNNGNSINKVVTWHDPCELGRHELQYDNPRKLIQAIPGIVYKELPDTRKDARCCGGGGGVKGVDAGLGMELALKRVEQAKSIGAEVIVSGCPACYDNINEGIKKAEANIKMMDITEIIAEALGLNEE
ncbi:(Fe-S)-binding protein [Candidatus Borrarchaeum sp.]|uniref:(Fe-S)-binding protein n=1 Tax=Candidatus Borrarchaeum sp. TaxID=2846742 RepID=UPI00257FEC04|nr:(Fe-S)-binding protein [Candidatus Borrarchaeum sp.]